MVSFVPIAQTNIDAIAKLAHALWPETSVEEMREHFAAVLADHNATAFIATHHSESIGFIELSTRTDYVEGADQLPVAYIEGIYVMPNYQKRGIAKMLVDQAENWSRTRGFHQLCSDTELDNHDSIQFHHAIGFEEVSRNVCFVKNL